jgi:hypothetical protein
MLPTGPGSKMTIGGQFMHEGIFDKGKMIGEGVMITFDKFGGIVEATRLKDGEPVGEIEINKTGNVEMSS